MNQIIFAAVVFATLCTPAYAGLVGNPELDGGTLSSLAAAFTGCYVAYRIYSAKRK